MNERMLDLAIQAKDWAYADHDGYTAQMLFEQKFAELIVRECASKVDWIYAEKGITNDGVNFTVTQGDLIKQHFGVEE